MHHGETVTCLIVYVKNNYIRIVTKSCGFRRTLLYMSLTIVQTVVNYLDCLFACLGLAMENGQKSPATLTTF